MKRMLARALRGIGYEVHAYNLLRNHGLRKKKLMADLGIDLVVDAGANVGQYAEGLRGQGYRGRIVSLEPIPAAFRQLKAKAEKSAEWEAHNIALGERDGEAELNVCDISEVSSLLPATGAATTASWTATNKQKVGIRTLDTLLPEIERGGERVYLKLDVQGYERQALAGAEQVLGRIVALEIESSTIPLYEGEWLFPEAVSRVSEKGFRVFSIEPVVVDHLSGEVLQFEILFARQHSPRPRPHSPS
jgi:FkbM family methyltransferase